MAGTRHDCAATAIAAARQNGELMGEPTAAAQTSADEFDNGNGEVVAGTDPSGRNTAVLVGFTAITNLADGFTKVALPLMATKLTSSPALVSIVLLTLTLPWLLVAMHVGVLVDRVDRRRLLWLANGMRIAAVASLFVAVYADAANLAMIYACGLVLGVAEVIALTSAAALIPDAVRPHGRERANAWVTSAETACNEFAGPFVGGLLVAAGAAVALGSTTVGYLLGMLALVFLAGRFQVRHAEAAAEQFVHGQIVEGLGFLYQQRLLRVLTVAIACFALVPPFLRVFTAAVAAEVEKAGA
jgi:MFS family permease